LAACIALIVLGAARGEARSFGQLAATTDGGAWVVEMFSSGNASRSELVHFDAAGRPTPEALPTNARLDAIAVSSIDGTLWVAVGDAALHRDAAGTWTSVTLPPSKQPSETIVPLASDRALVLRDGSTCFQCTEVLHVDLAANVASARTFEVRMRGGVLDGNGGAWLLLVQKSPEPGSGMASHDIAGFAHVTSAGWDSWSSEGQRVDGMRDMGETTATPALIAATPGGGFVGADPYTLYFIAADGTPQAVHLPPGGDSLAIAARGDELLRVRLEDLQPMVERFAHDGRLLGSDRIDMPAWWRARHDRIMPAIQISAGGSSVWLATHDALMWRGDRWHVVAAEADADAVEFGPRHVFWSLPIELGGAIRKTSSDGFAVGVRPEIVWARSKHYPRFGVGGFFEAVTSTPSDSMVGAGVTALVYGGTMGGALSLGADLHWFDGRNQVTAVASLFVGIRSPADYGPHDQPVGVRIDYRPGSDTLSTSTTISFVLDLWAIEAAAETVVGSIYGLTHIH
jgi:hypothetical protein